MNKISNKLILISTILTFVFGLSFSPVYAQRSAIVIPPLYYPITYTPTIYYNQTPVVYSIPVYYNDNSTIIPGCEGRTTGFSTITGQSCVGNYVNTPTTIVKNYNTYNTTVPTTTKTINDGLVASDTKENYGSLAANALFGSNGFMPSGLVQWIFFVLLILAIIFLWRYVHHSEEKYRSEPMKHA